MLRSELQLFLNADPEIRVIRLGVQLSTFVLFHSFKAKLEAPPRSRQLWQKPLSI
jgi:hypothetical protein